MSITDWLEEDRPREKLLQKGAAALTDAELLAIFLRVGVKGKSAVDLGRDLVQKFGGLQALFAASEADLCQVHGMGQAKYVQLQAVIEMSRRALGEALQPGATLQSPDSVRDYLILWLRGKPYEVFAGIFLDAQHRVLAIDELFDDED